MKGKLGGKIMTELVGLRVKTYRYSLDDSWEIKKENSQKVCHNKRTKVWKS